MIFGISIPALNRTPSKPIWPSTRFDQARRDDPLKQYSHEIPHNNHGDNDGKEYIHNDIGGNTPARVRLHHTNTKESNSTVHHLVPRFVVKHRIGSVPVDRLMKHLFDLSTKRPRWIVVEVSCQINHYKKKRERGRRLILVLCIHTFLQKVLP